MSASPPPRRVLIGLGSNLDSPRQRLRQAFDDLAALAGVTLRARSSLYASSPVGFLDQPDFINAAAAIDTTLSPRALLTALLELERRAGRVRDLRNGPRTLDIDILLYGDDIISEADLQIPHPRIQERAFVLKPLLELAPDAVIPGRGPARDFLPAVAGQHCEKLPDAD